MVITNLVQKILENFGGCQ